MRTCTCIGICKGPDGLAPGWDCALKCGPVRHALDDWRKTVQLVAVALGEQSLDAATLSESALQLRADLEQAKSVVDIQQRALLKAATEHAFDVACGECGGRFRMAEIKMELVDPLAFAVCDGCLENTRLKRRVAELEREIRGMFPHEESQ